MDLTVIRFKCPNCGRYYEVSQLLQRIPLLCKGCGNRIDVPETSQEPEPAPSIPEMVIPPISSPSVKSNGAVVAKTSTPVAHVAAVGASIATIQAEDHDAILETGAQQKIDTEVIPAITLSKLHEDEEAESTKHRKLLYVVIDVMMGLFLLLVGGLIGEFLAQKSTGDVWHDAGSAAKFPPIDLLLWLSVPTTLILIYYLLVTKRKSLGTWLQRRSERSF